MTFLELVQKAIRKSGAKVDVPTTIVGADGLTEMFVEWVQDAWKDIQIERLGWKWRVLRDQIMAINNTEDEYAIPAALESLNPRTMTIYNATTTEGPLEYLSYEDWRWRRTLLNSSPSRPLYFTFTPDGNVAFLPFPDDSYSVRYDGVRKVELLDTADDNDTPTQLDEEYHDGIMWLAVKYYAQHFEDGTKYQEAVDRFKPYKKYYEAVKLPDVTIDTTYLYRRRV